MDRLIARHLKFGWWSLAGYLILGLSLESLHGFKVDWYVDAGSETRRLLFTLAHAHGTLVALINVAFGLMLARHVTVVPRGASRCLILGSLLLPLGFFLGGIQISGGDPGSGIVLSPLGAVLLILAVVGIARLPLVPVRPEIGAELRSGGQAAEALHASTGPAPPAPVKDKRRK